MPFIQTSSSIKFTTLLPLLLILSACGSGSSVESEIASESEANILSPLITSGPSSESTSASAEFQFSWPDASSYQCNLNNQAWVDCNSPHTVDTQASGDYQVSIQALGPNDSIMRAEQWAWTATNTTLEPEAENETHEEEPEGDSQGQGETEEQGEGEGDGHHHGGSGEQSVGDVTAASCSNDCPLLWNDPATWGGNLPSEGNNIVIGNDSHVLLNSYTPALAGVTINGTLEFARQNVAITADWIVLHGEMHIGSEAEPFTQTATITLTGDNTEESVMGMGTRGILIMGGVLEMHGATADTLWTRINQHAAAGSNQLQLQQPVDWQAGDQVVVAPTDYYGAGETEQFEISQINGEQVTLSANLNTARWGLLQYITSNGVSLPPDGSVTPSVEPTPLVLDERAAVGNLSRNIVIQGADDTLWQQQGFGAHLMIMSLDSQIHADGVEFRRVGQAGNLGRYPWHWHRLSYADDGSELGDANGHYLRNSSIHQSANRCITIHASNGTEVSNNICYDILGHGIFFEDAVERRNVVQNNLVLHTRSPADGNALKIHEIRGGDSGASGLWVSNPDNTIRNNHATDAEGFGLWMAFPFAPVGASANVPIHPYRTPFGNFDGNVLHSNRLEGIMFDFSESDDLGNTIALQYASTSDGEDYAYPYDTLQRVEITGTHIWKNGTGGLWNRVVWPSYIEWVSADNEGRFFAGSGGGGLISRSLLVGTSLNHPTERPNPWIGPEAAFATYHSGFDIRNNVAVNFPLVQGERSGLFAADDYYLRAVDKGQVRNPGNLLINTHGGYRSRAQFPYFALAGALWDPNGIWGPAGNYFVYDEPFLTFGANCVDVAPSNLEAGGTSCDGEYYSIDRFVLNLANNENADLMAIDATRYNEANPDEAVGVWHLDSAQSGWGLDHMRHFAARHDGIYTLAFPDETELPTDVAFEVQNARNEENTFVLGVQFDGNEPAQVFASTYRSGYLSEGHANAPDFDLKRNYTSVDSRQAVIDSVGWTYYQDVANNIVWIRIAGGMQQQWNEEDFEPNDNELLYWPWKLRVW